MNEPSGYPFGTHLTRPFTAIPLSQISTSSHTVFAFTPRWISSNQPRPYPLEGLSVLYLQHAVWLRNYVSSLIQSLVECNMPYSRFFLRELI